jgi:HlyD family secretion protein
MRVRPLPVIVVCLIVAVVAWLSIQKALGPPLPAYQVSAKPLVQTVVATGRVAALSRAQVGSQVTGVVLERRVKEGDRVEPGDVLAVLRADDLEAAVREARAELAQLEESTRPQAEAALREAEIALTQAARESQRRRALFQERAIPKEELERAVQAEAAARAAAEKARLVARSLVSGNPNETLARARLANAEAQLAKTIIRAELSGTVLTRNAEPGDLVQPNRVLFEIARDGDTEILVPIDEKNLQALAMGQSALCVTDAYPTQAFTARIRYIAPSVDPQRGTVDVRLVVDNPPEFLREDMTVSVNVETGRRDSALVVPNDALLAVRGNDATVWRVVDGRATRRKVQLGLRGLVQTEVTQGLESDDLVLADAASSVSEGQRVRVHEIGFEVNAPEAQRATRRELPMPLD